LVTHAKNYLANRTTNERLSKARGPAGKEEEGGEDGLENTDMSSSIMTMSDFEESQVMESGIDGQELMK